MPWQQIYNPFGNMLISTLLAAIPVVVMLVCLGFLHLKAHLAAGLGLIAALLVAVLAYGMPAQMAGLAAFYGGITGLLPIGWIVLTIIFLQQLAEENGSFKVLQDSLSGITTDRRLQLLLIAFCFGVHGYDLMEVTAMIGRQLPFFSLLVPFWLIWAFAGRRAMLEIWPAILVTGLGFAIPQYLVSNFIGPELVDIIAALVSMVALVSFLRVWQPAQVWTSPSLKGHENDGGVARPAVAITRHQPAELLRAWTPWLILTVFVFIWGLPAVKTYLNSLYAPQFEIVGLHNLVMKMPPVVTAPKKEAAVYVLNLLSATGTGILLAAIVGALVMQYKVRDIARIFFRTVWLVRYSLLTIVLMLALGTITRYSGTDTTLGLAFANSGVLYPFFGTLMGWLGVAMTGSDTASNVLFGGMQKVAADQLGLSHNLMGAANSSGGVMGKMIDAQSIVVASTATRWFNHEGDILRYVFFHSIALASLVGILVTLQAYVFPFTLLVGH